MSLIFKLLIFLFLSSWTFAQDFDDDFFSDEDPLSEPLIEAVPETEPEPEWEAPSNQIPRPMGPGAFQNPQIKRPSSGSGGFEGSGQDYSSGDSEVIFQLVDPPQTQSSKKKIQIPPRIRDQVERRAQIQMQSFE